MKIFDAQQIRQADEMTISNQGLSSYELMERAGTQAFLWLKRKFPDKETVFHCFCGQGNNGGDGLVVARMLHEDGYLTIIDIAKEAGKPTDDFLASLEKIKTLGIECSTGQSYEYKQGKFVIIDALFGIGLTRPLPDSIKQVIERINNSNACVVAIDVPSGMFMDRPTEFAVHSDIILTFQFPKLAFYLSGNCSYCNAIVILDIGLDKDFISNTHSGYFLSDKFSSYKRYHPVPAHAHKGSQGHALIIGGSYGKIGAACLAAKAALKSGSGLVTAYIPECGYAILQTAFPEAMVLTGGDTHITGISFDLQPKAIGIGMGLGQHPDTQKALGDFLKLQQGPMVIDADALNILSYNKEWLSHLPENTILTPHPKEMERLMGSWNDDFEKIEMMKAFSARHKIIIVAKDAHTMIVCNSQVCINATGNAGLATGGSGDVLTGIITGLLAQSYNPADAAIFGVYLHGLTADIGTKETGLQAFTASDILKYLGKAYLKIEADHAQK
jgi:hydroxyethylthiazole kinase-like uncharacterized protein yjeF